MEKTEQRSSGYNKAHSRAYYLRKKQQDPDYYKTKAKERRDIDPETYNAIALKYKEKYPERMKDARAKYYSTPKGKNKWREIASNRQKAVSRQKIRKFFLKEIQEVYRNCPQDMEVDHMIPLNGKLVSGLHVPWNLAYLPPTINRQKSNKILLEHTI